MTLNTIPSAARKTSIESLQPLLASSLYLARMAKHAHWNVTGPNFIGIHRLLDEVYSGAEGWADTIAERIRGLGGVAKGTPEEFIEGNRLRFLESGVEDQKLYIEMISGSLGVLSKLFRSAIEPIEDGDPGTANTLADLSNAADHFIYLLESHLG